MGIVIEPSQVHFILSLNNPYNWKVLPEKEELFLRIFLKNISNYSISAYKELYKGVSIIFKAI